MATTYGLIAVVLLVVIVARILYRGAAERCPDCGARREGDAPICSCGWAFAYPEDELPIEYGDPDDAEK